MTDNNTALKKAGLKVTLPRLKILEVLQEPDNHHVSAEDLYKRLIDMGITTGTVLFIRKVAPMGDPIEIRCRGYELSLRKDEAKTIEVRRVG